MRISRNKRIFGRIAATLCLTMVVSTLTAASSPGGTGENVPTNLQMLEMTAEDAVDELMANMPDLPKGTLVALTKESGVGDDIDRVFENVMKKRMMSSGLRVALRKKGEQYEENPSYEMTYQIIRFALKYPEIGRSYWLGAKEVERLAETGVFAQLIDLGSGEIVWVGDTSKTREDRIAYSMLQRVEDPQLDFTQPQRNELKLGSLVEPVVVTGIVVGLVYLFFSNQDTN